MKLKIREIAIFAMLGALMFASKKLMEVFPNIHIVGVLLVAITIVYRWKALYPLYLYVLLDGIFGGFAFWWIPYLYIWTILWGAVMLLPKKMPEKIQPVVYAVVCSLHGFLFGTLYAPVQALLYGMNFQGMLSWIVAGLPFDCIHGVSNLLCGLLIIPLVRVIRMADPKAEKQV